MQCGCAGDRLMEARAWLLNFGDGTRAAIGLPELLHVVPQPGLFEVPRTPRHCSRALVWQNHVVPVWDVLAWLRPGTHADRPELAAIVGYQSRRGQPPRFGALLLAEPPGRIGVSDDQACGLPPGQPRLDEIACSCFRHGDAPVAVLDLPLMFSGAFAGR
jgi:hypothetical protein